MSVFFIADTHFGDERIIEYENRPFADVETMENAVVSAWNGMVGADDTVWHLGDFGAKGREAEVLKKLNGHVRLVRGNHDAQPNDYYRSCGFEEVYDLPVVLEGFWLLSHEPMYVNTNMPYANIFGHVHANPAYKDYSPQHFCASLERLNYAPVSFETIKKAVLG